MKRLGLPVIFSLAMHALILAALAFWASSENDLPLAGSGGGSGVTVEIVGGFGPHGENGKETLEHPAAPKTQPDLPGAPKIASKVQRPKAKMGTRGGDNIPVGTPGPAGPGQGPGAPGPGVGENGTNAILAEIHARIERAKRYPIMARQMSMEGVSYVRFEIDGSGQPQGIALKTSSGFPVLDDEALATIRRAAPFPAYGDSLVVGIRFHMEH